MTDVTQTTELLLQQSALFRTLQARGSSTPHDSEAVTLVRQAADYAHHRTKCIIRHMGEFTLHDVDHLFRVVLLMESLLGAERIAELSSPELLLLLLAAFFHDIGMAPTEEEVRAWRGQPYDAGSSAVEKSVFDEWRQQFQHFLDGRPDDVAALERLHDSGEHAQAEVLHAYLVTEYIRRTHADRARSIIAEDWESRIVYGQTNLSVELASICYSHNEDALTLLELDGRFPCGSGAYACLPFLGVVLRLADILDFDGKRTPEVLFRHLGIRHPVSLSEWQKHRAVESWTIERTPRPLISFAARCTHPAIEESIRRFCDAIDHELLAAAHVLGRLAQTTNGIDLGETYQLSLPSKVERGHIAPKTNVLGQPQYRYRNVRFTLSQREIISILMGTQLYGSPDIALRELLQNSIDACRVRAQMETSWGNSYSPSIRVRLAQDQGGGAVLRVVDNGVGMDEEIITKFFSKVGASYYRSSAFFELRARHGFTFTPTSRFGIGVLSCFMVAPAFEVESRRLLGQHDSSPPLRLRIEGPNALFWFTDGVRPAPGTELALRLRNDNPWSGLSDADFRSAIRAVVPFPPVPVFVNESDEPLTPASASAHVVEHSNWPPVSNPFIARFELDVESEQDGIEGRAIVLLLREDDKLVERVTQFEEYVHIESYGYAETSTSELRLRDNCIDVVADSLSVEDGAISKDTTYTDVVRSRAIIALSGVRIPWDIFGRGFNRRPGMAYLNLPFPVHLSLNFVGSADLDVNPARTEIHDGPTWRKIQRLLRLRILEELSNCVGPEDAEFVRGLLGRTER